MLMLHGDKMSVGLRCCLRLSVLLIFWIERTVFWWEFLCCYSFLPC